MKTHRVVREGDQAHMVASVGASIKKALSDYYTKNNLSDTTRIKLLKEQLPEALQYYRR